MAGLDAEIGIVGAGIAGASLAGELSRHRSVILFEREPQPGTHATGRSAAYFAPAYGNDIVRRITAASEPFLRTPPAGFAPVPLLLPRAALFIANAQQKDALNTFMLQTPGCQQLAGAECRELVPSLIPTAVSGGVLDASGGDLDVDALLQAYLRLLRVNGGRLLQNRGIRGLAQQPGGWQLSTADGEYFVQTVVNAAGAWADEVAGLAGLGALGLTPKRRTAALVDPPQDQDIDSWPLTIDIDENFYFKPEAGQLLVSPADETPSPAVDAFAEELDVARAIARVQEVADIPVTRVNHAWAGLRTFAPDNSFVSGFDPRAQGFYWLVGQGGYGVQSCPAMAAIATHNICGETESLDPVLAAELAARIRPDRLLG